MKQGYKIELTAEEQGMESAEPIVTHNSINISSLNTAGAESSVVPPAPVLPQITPTLPPRPMIPIPTAPLPMPVTNVSVNPASGMISSAVGMAGAPVPGYLPPAPTGQPGQMQQAHAIHYVTKIRNRFSNEPDTYR